MPSPWGRVRPLAIIQVTGDIARRTVLLADDDDALRNLLSRTLSTEGYEVHEVANGDDAIAAYDERPFDLVLSDIDMPGRSGIELLQAIRARDLDVPFVLLTGGPKLETAMSAVEFGASHYLTKPVDVARLRNTIRRAMHAGALARARRTLADFAGVGGLPIADVAGLGARFDKALEMVYVLCQPIVRWSTRSTFAYEALVRSNEPTISLPAALFDAADRLDRVIDIGRRVREICGEPMGGERVDALLFVNLHTRDLLDESLYARDSPLASIAPGVVLEITERARLETVRDVAGCVARLREMGFRIAVDDIGAGYAGLTSFAALEPEFVKLDRALVQDMHLSQTKTRLVGAMIHACNDLGVQVIGEGVETVAERDALVELGCDLLQGFLFSRPQLPFARPTL